MPDINMQVFEEAKRNQLVTEVDIQTQVALDDYQVQLSDIANPTQSQDNVIIDRFGEFLSHWNESLDFDTWVKMSMEIAGKRILMLRGNSSVGGISSILDTFMSGNDFSTDLTGWSETLKGSGMTTSITSGELNLIRTGDPIGSASIISNSIYTNDFIFEYRMKKPDGDEEYAYFGFGAGNIVDNDGGTSNWWFTYKQSGYAMSYADGGNLISNEITEMPASGGRAYLTDDDIDYGTITGYKTYSLQYTSSGLLRLLVDNVLLSSVTDTTFLSNLKNLYISQGSYSLSGRGGTQVIEWVRARKYTAIEPTHSINTEQNLVTALKSLGRAG